MYWIFGGIYTVLDIVNKPAALRRYKIQPGTNEPVETKKLLKVGLLSELHGYLFQSLFHHSQLALTHWI